jgi:hypothetical protein
MTLQESARQKTTPETLGMRDSHVKLGSFARAAA